MSASTTTVLKGVGDVAALTAPEDDVLTVMLTCANWGGVAFEYQGGSGFVPLYLTPVRGGDAAVGASNNGSWRGTVPSGTQLQVRCSSYSGSPITVSLFAQPASIGSGGGGGGGGAITAADNAIVTLGSITDPATILATGVASVMSFLKGLMLILGGIYNQANQYLNVNLATGLARTADTISSAIETATVMNGTTELTISRASVSVSASGQTQLVAATANKKCKVLRYCLRSDAAVRIKFQSGSTDLTGPMDTGAAGGGVQAYCPIGEFETAVNTALNINLDAAVQVSGYIVYVLY